MKLNVAYSQNEVETLGVLKSTSFGLGDDAEEMIFTMFTKNIYSNPIGSIVREITSNCFDSHKEANVDDAVVVMLTKENNQHYISFIDVGMGMSPERVTKIYAKYFNSTKRNDNNLIGGFGIGGKTPLAYGESFFLTTNFDGLKYTYCIRKGTKRPIIDLLEKKKTTERNGTTVKVPILSSDVYVFEREINRQLYYFENVIFEGFSSTVKNDYRIIEGKNFKFRGKDYNQYVHICLGSVAYPIDFNLLDGLDSDKFYSGNWNVPVAIKMEIGEINVTASREAIDYTEDTKKLIKKKLKAVKEEMLAMLDKQQARIDTLEEFYRMENDAYNLILSDKENDVVNISSFADHRKIVFNKLNALEIPSRSEVIDMFYHISILGKKKRRENTWNKSLRGVENQNVFLLDDDEVTIRKQNAYMKRSLGHFYTITKAEMTDEYFHELITKITPTNTQVDRKTIINQYNELKKEVYKLVEKLVKKYSSVVVPDGFKIATGGNRYNPNFELPVTFDYEYGGFTKERVKISDLVKSKATIFYGDLNDDSEMRWAFDAYKALFNPITNDEKFSIAYRHCAYPIAFIMVSKSNIRHIAGLKNLKPIAEFKKVLVRKRNKVVSYLEKRLFMDEYGKLNNLFLNQNLFNEIDSNYAKTIESLLNIKKKYESVKDIENISFSQDSQLLKVLNIDLSGVTFNGSDHMNVIKSVTEKNGMLHHVKIYNDFNPVSKYSGYSQTEIENILKLINLAYIK